MAFFDSLFSELFPKKKESSPLAQYLLKETIKRTKFFMLEYEQWVLAKMHHGLQNHLNEMRMIRISNPAADVNYFVHESKLSNGFYFYLEEPWSGKDYSFFVQYIIEKLKEEGYYINNSLREAKEQGDELLTIEEFYLKPSLRFRRELPYEQLFGNVHLELKSKNDEVQMIKVVVNSYSDRNFKEAVSYDKFLDLFLLSA
jgi:hypothetical protein